MFLNKVDSLKRALQGAFLSKTIYFNLIVLVLAILTLPEFVAVIPVGFLPYLGIITAVGNIILRAITGQPLAGKVKKL